MTISVGGEIGEVGKTELDRGGAARLPRRLPRGELERAGARRDRASRRSASRPGRRTAACRCPTAAWPRSSSTSRSSAARRGRPRDTAWPAPSSTAPRPCPTSCSTASRRSRRPRSTSPPASRTSSTSTPPSRRSSTTRDRGVVLRERRRRAQAGPDRPAVRVHDPQEGDRAVQAAALGARDEGRDPGRPGREDRVPVHASCGSNGSRAMVERYVRPVELHRPIPDALRGGRGERRPALTPSRERRPCAGGAPALSRETPVLIRAPHRLPIRSRRRARCGVEGADPAAKRRPASPRSPQRSARTGGAVEVGGGTVAGPVISARTGRRATTRTCARSGIKPELKRTLGFLSNFAVAFSYISVSTGTFTQLRASAFGLGGPVVLLGVAARRRSARRSSP